MSGNRLADETSPYLLQHKDNPVHWRAWGPAALAEARDLDRPILLSVGYAACHWCHVMAHESFEDDATAAVMNELFVNIKVDREERPDVDAIYMAALHALGEPGGWPLTMFLAPDGRPFWGGTYFPKTARYGKPAFQTALKEIAEVYRENPAKILQNAESITSGLRQKAAVSAPILLDDTTIANIGMRLLSITDPEHGGIRGAPKFPQWSFLWLLWRTGIRYSLEPCQQAVVKALTHICQGGIYDHVGGGFARYSVDERWLAPHFEKMLYDNALLIDLMSEVWRETQSPLLKARVAETVGWLLREMVAEGGGFAASLDADSEGEEGKFYVWSAAEIGSVLGGADAEVFCGFYDVQRQGNWEGHSILNRLHSLEWLGPEVEQRLAGMRAKLLAARGSRVRPGWDDKVLGDWNGLMIAALAHAARTFGRPDWLAAAERAFGFVIQHMVVEGRLRHSARAGRADAPATASDHANLIAGALRLYQVTSKASYLAKAEQLAAMLDTHYWMEAGGGYAFSADDTPDLIARLVHAHDDATPNANGVMVSNLMTLFVLTGSEAYASRAQAVLDRFGGEIAGNLFAHTGLIGAACDVIAPQQIVVVGGSEPQELDRMQAALSTVSAPGAVQQAIADLSGVAPGSPLAGKSPVAGKATAYVCIGPQCSAPVTEPEELAPLIRRLRLTARMADADRA